VVFIHGFNVSFADAVMRTAQIAYDLGLSGPPLLYSWPSQADERWYVRDAETIERTKGHLRHFLKDVVLQVRASKIHLIAHSMGNRALGGVLAEFDFGDAARRFNEVILAAPDVDRETFLEDIAPYIGKTAARVTLYACATDKPLLISKFIHNASRAGGAGADLIVVQGIETVDASSISSSVFSMDHGYFAEVEPVLKDVRAIIMDGFPPAQRGLTLKDRNGLKYWSFP
jgi:esterase/lipase superfamily enzyme